MVGPTLGQRRDDSANVGPALSQRWADRQCCLGLLFLWLVSYCFVTICFVASPVSDTILSDYKWAQFSFADLLYVRT